MFTADKDSYPQPQYEEIRINHVEVLENLKGSAEKSIDSLMQQKRPKGNRLWDLDPWTKKMGRSSVPSYIDTDIIRREAPSENASQDYGEGE